MTMFVRDGLNVKHMDVLEIKLCRPSTVTMLSIWLFVFELWWGFSPATAENFKVGYLTADRTERFVKNKQGRIISGAMTWAIDTVNEDPDLLKGHNLTFIWSNTRADQLVGTRELTLQWREGAIAFFGPEDSCDVESRVAGSWNLPMISYKCADHRVSDKTLHPTFARTYPRPTQVTRSIMALLEHFHWKKFTTIVGSSGQWQSIAEKLRELALRHNYTINDRFDFAEPHTPDSEGYKNPFPKIVANSYRNTRVYVFLGEHNGMVDMLSNLEERNLLDNGEYVVIYVDLGTYDNVDPLRYFKLTHDRPNLQRNVEAAQSLLVIVSSPPTDNEAYQKFQRKVNQYNERPPFSFPNPFGVPKQITVYGAYLYDAVLLYAKALDEVLKENGSATDGVAIINRIRNRAFTSILGFLSYMDDNGDAEGNYTVLSRHYYPSKHSNYSMVPAGHFHLAGSHLPSFQLLANQRIDWVKGAPPLDEPPCGFQGELCLVPPMHNAQKVATNIAENNFSTMSFLHEKCLDEAILYERNHFGHFGRNTSYWCHRFLSGLQELALRARNCRTFMEDFSSRYPGPYSGGR